MATDRELVVIVQKTSSGRVYALRCWFYNCKSRFFSRDPLGSLCVLTCMRGHTIDYGSLVSSRVLSSSDEIEKFSRSPHWEAVFARWSLDPRVLPFDLAFGVIS